MVKREIQRMPIVVLVALLALFLGTGIAAAGPAPNTGTCTLLNSTGQNTPYTVKFNGATTYGVYPNDNTSWSYTHTLAGTQVAILVPVCDPVQFPPPGNVLYNGNNYVATQSGTVIYNNNPPFNTSLSTNWNGFGVWDVLDQLVTVTSTGSTTFSFGTDNVVPIPLRVTSMQFKSGNNYFYCPNIAGPGCAVAPPPRAQQVLASYTRYDGIDSQGIPFHFCTVTDPVDQCPRVLVDCDHPERGVIGPGNDPNNVFKPLDQVFFGSQPNTTMLNISVDGQACPSVTIEDNGPGSTQKCYPWGCVTVN